VTGFGLANPNLVGEREAVVGLLQQVPANRPAPGTLLVGDKGLAGRDFPTALAALELALVGPARTDEADPGIFPNWLRQRIEASIWTLKGQLGMTTRAAGSRPGCGRGWCSACSRSTPPSGSTGRSAPRPSVP
jgi:hypothetical protein